MCRWIFTFCVMELPDLYPIALPVVVPTGKACKMFMQEPRKDVICTRELPQPCCEQLRVPVWLKQCLVLGPRVQQWRRKITRGIREKCWVVPFVTRCSRSCMISVPVACQQVRAPTACFSGPAPCVPATPSSSAFL